MHAQNVSSGRAALRWLALALGIAAANYVSGRLGLLLALPPGFATAVWPPSGIALAALLLFGYRVWPGVLLGSVAMNIFIAMQSGPTGDWFSAGRVAVFIGLGSTLQAAAGAWLIRRFVGFPNPLLFEREIGLFLLLGGPVSCLIAATIGIGTLVASGLMPPAVAAFQWWTWWIGDTIGVLTLTPLLLIALSEPRAVWRARLGPVGVPLTVAFVIAVLVFIYASRSEQARIEAASDRLRENISLALTRDLHRNLDVLNATAGLFESSVEVSAAEFRTFTGKFLPRLPGVQAISWNPRVTRGERAVFESRARQDGDQAYRFIELVDENPRAASDREVHVAIYYIEPHAGNEAALGFDLESDPVRHEALARAVDSGRPAASESVTLLQETAHQNAVLLIAPVYRKAAPRETVAQRRQNITGFVVMALRMGDVVAAALRGVAPDGLVVAVEDESARPANRALLPPQTLTGIATTANTDQQSSITVADRQWTLRHSAGGAAAERSLVAWAVLAGGMLFTSLLGALLLAVTGRATHVRRLMQDTSDALQKLQDTQKQLVQAEKLAALGELVAGVSHEINTPVGIGVTAASYLRSEVVAVSTDLAEGKLSKSHLERFLSASKQSADMILRNLERAAELIKSFKQVAVDQATDERRTIELKGYLDETLISLRPRFKHTPHKLVLNCPDHLVLETVPGALSQIFTNLVVNSLVHAFSEEQPGTMRFDVIPEPGRVILRFSDDGRGILPEHLPKVFDPFFTTRRGQGGTGLGLNIVFNLVTVTLRGTIDVSSKPGAGTVFTITLPERMAA